MEYWSFTCVTWNNFKAFPAPRSHKESPGALTRLGHWHETSKSAVAHASGHRLAKDKYGRMVAERKWRAKTYPIGWW